MRGPTSTCPAPSSTCSEPDVPETLAAVRPEQEITIVPLLLSAGYHVKVDLAEAAAGSPSTVGVTGALGPDARLADVLARRLARGRALRDGDRVVLAAAGSTDAAAVADCHVMGHLLAAVLRRPVAVSFISAAEPRVPDAVAAMRASGPGRVVRRDLPARARLLRDARRSGRGGRDEPAAARRRRAAPARTRRHRAPAASTTRAPSRPARTDPSRPFHPLPLRSAHHPHRPWRHR